MRNLAGTCKAGIRRSLSISAAVLLFASFCGLVAVPTANADSCPSLKMLVTTGSGEHTGFGHVLGAVVSTVYAGDTNNASAERTDYPALSVLSPDVIAYNWSVGLGITALSNRISSFLQACHHTPLFLVGYSQGAQVTGDVYLHYLSDAERARIAGIVVFGDPQFWGQQGSPINVGSYIPNMIGISTEFYPSNPQHHWPQTDAAKIRSYCAQGDVICNFNGANAVRCGFFACPHAEYASSETLPGGGTYTDSAGKFILSRWRGTAPPPSPEPTVSSGGGSAPPSAPTFSSGLWPETAGGVTHTWTSPSAQTSQGPSILAGQSVGIACRVPGTRVSDGNAWWYQVGSSPWNGGYYASADAFYNNGRTFGSLLGTPFDDAAVPPCTSSPAVPAPAPGPAPSPTPNPAPPTASGYVETTGGVASTWTDYNNAGGTQGPSIPSNDSVQIACKLTGFTVADGNSWWYRIASSPWNSTYYVSADAFYNNGATSGSLHGTPFVDPNVSNC